MTELDRKSGIDFGELKPSKEFVDGNFHWFAFSPEQTGLYLICLEDTQTGLVLSSPLSNREVRTAALKAWAGARHSRSPGYPWEIMAEIVGKDVDADEKIDQMFRGYGHASVGDMAKVQVDFSNCPMHLCFSIFNSVAINSGQEKSTRYQSRFGKSPLHGVENYLPSDFPSQEVIFVDADYRALGEMSLNLVAKYKTRLSEVFTGFFRPKTDDEVKSLNSRVLDCTRFFLLFGQRAGMSFETSVRDYSRLVGEMRASNMGYYRSVADQLKLFLAPAADVEEEMGFLAEAPSLMRHAEPAETANSNLNLLRDYLISETDILAKLHANTVFLRESGQEVTFLGRELSEADKLVAEYILLMWPGLQTAPLIDWVRSLPDEKKKEASRIIYCGHDSHKELPVFAKTTGMTLALDASLGEIRDLNRQRGWGRFVPLPLVFGNKVDSGTMSQIIANGFGMPLYLTDIRDFANARSEFGGDLMGYYDALYTFFQRTVSRYGEDIDYSLFLNLLPLAHKSRLFMHGDPKQASYMPSLRARPGGHINYRMLAYDSSKLIAQSDPYLEGLELVGRPNPESREEFFDRS